MTRRLDLTSDKILIYGIFFATLVIAAIFLITGEAWVVVSIETMAVWVIFVSVFLAILGGVIATYSFVSYRQTQELRFLVLGLLGFDMVLVGFAFLFTHPSSVLWIPAIADRQRNRSMAVIIAMALVPSVLSGAFRGDVPILDKKWLYSIWGIIIVPAFVFWFTLSPEPVIITTITSGESGVFNATIEGIMVLVSAFAAFVLSFIRYRMEWRKNRDRIILASTLSLTLWILSLILLAILDDPYYILEIIWYSLIGAGFLLIAVAMIITSILEPHKVLYEIVDDRTRKLEQSEEEIVFYLDMWTHKIGNILQGMMTYLEVLATTPNNVNISMQTELAQDLGREGNLVNRQVIALTKIKQTKGKPLTPVNLRDAFTVASEDILSYYSVKGTPSLDIRVNPDIHVEADALLDQLFLSLFIHMAKKQDVENLLIIVNSESLNDSIVIEIVCSEPVLTTQAQKYIAEVGISTQTQLGLELFIMKILLARYHCKMKYSVDTETKESRLTFYFKNDMIP
ncbi:MAG: hypothetical protein ACTSV2_04960 [Candidatus Thorarchaeota archaeon]